jgi:hypothetical protein
MSRAHATRPTPARMVRAPGPVRASSPELSSTSASSAPVRSLKHASGRGRGRNLPGHNAPPKRRREALSRGVARSEAAASRRGEPSSTNREARRMCAGRRGRRSRRGPGWREASPRRPTVPRARGMERTSPAAPRGRGPRGRGTSGAVGAARSGNLDVVRIVARRFYCGASVDALGPRSRGESAPSTRGTERADPTIPTREGDDTCRPRRRRRRRSQHAPGGVDEPVVVRGAGGSGAPGGASATEVRPRRFCPGASGGTHRSPSVRGGGPRVRAHAAAARPNSRP